MDVKLSSGNIDGITKFKLFAPIARNYENGICYNFLEMIGFLSPRTSLVDVFMDDLTANKYIEEK